MEEAILISYGGHAKSVLDSLEACSKYRIIGYTDIQEQSSPYKYLGTDEVIEKYYHSGIKNLIMGIGYLGKGSIREVIFQKYKALGFEFPTVVDPTAIVSKTAQIGEGTFVGKGAIINAYAQIGKMSIINTKAIIEHECIIGDYAHISVGSILCGNVVVEDSAFVGANATVIQGRRVCKNEIIPAGVIVR